jgi:hypothetical protein
LVRAWRRGIASVILPLRGSEKTDRHAGRVISSLNRARSSEGKPDPLKTLSLKLVLYFDRKAITMS